MSRRKELKKFSEHNIINALYGAGFAAAHWERLGLQLNRPQTQLINIRADRADADDKLTSMITQWMAGDLSASWESLAAALEQTTGYGLAAAVRLRRAVGLPDPSSGKIVQNEEDVTPIEVGDRKENTLSGKRRTWMPYLLVPVFVIAIALVYSSPQSRSTIASVISQFSSKVFASHGHSAKEKAIKDRFPVEDNAQEEEPTVKICTEITNVQDAFKDLREFVQWRQLGAELKIADNSLNVIDVDNRDTASRTQAVLRKWFNMNERVCWEDIVVALNAIDEANLAKKIAEKHIVT